MVKIYVFGILFFMSFISGPIAAAQMNSQSVTEIVIPAVKDKDNISNPQVGQTVYDVTDDVFYSFDKTGQPRSISGTANIFSEVRTDTGNGHGSTNTKIRRFANSSSQGTAITYADSATAGGTFTINEAGIYSVTYFDGVSGTTGYLGISKNSTQNTTAIQDISSADAKVGLTYTPVSGAVSTVAVTLKLVAGDVIRAHTDGSPNASSTNSAFRISKISN